MNAAQQHGNWWQAFYQEMPFELFLHGKERTAVEATIDFLWRRLELTGGALVFDQCCGTGSLSIPIAQRGARVIGVDLCEKFIRLATGTAVSVGCDCCFCCADAFEYVPDRACDAAINWWTSFGYSPDDEQNLRMLQNAYAALKPGGRFALDYPNIGAVLREPKGLEEYTYTIDGGEVRFTRQTSINLGAGLREQVWTCIRADGSRLIHHTALKMYLPHQLIEMASRCGFREVALFGAVTGEPLRLESERCILLARKPPRVR